MVKKINEIIIFHCLCTALVLGLLNRFVTLHGNNNGVNKH